MAYSNSTWWHINTCCWGSNWCLPLASSAGASQALRRSPRRSQHCYYYYQSRHQLDWSGRSAAVASAHCHYHCHWIEMNDCWQCCWRCLLGTFCCQCCCCYCQLLPAANREYFTCTNLYTYYYYHHSIEWIQIMITDKWRGEEKERKMWSTLTFRDDDDSSLMSNMKASTASLTLSATSGIYIISKYWWWGR